MSPLLKSVEKAGIRAIRRKRNPASITADDFFSETEILRQAFATLVGAADPKRIVVISSVSYGMATVVRNAALNKGDKILVAAEQFPSNYYPWQRLANDRGGSLTVVGPDKDLKGRGRKWNEKILDAITSETRIVALGQLHWADGTRFDLDAIRKRTKDVGALLVIDGTQSVGALPINVSALQPDALICAGYKWLLGPYSIGLAYYGEAFDNGVPLEENWMNRLNSEDFTSLVRYQPEYQPGALRYEMGEHSNFIHVPMLIKAVDQLNRWKPGNIQAYCQSITSSSIEALKEKDFWVEDEPFRSAHLFGVRLPHNLALEQVKTKLARNNIFVSYRGDAIRVSPNVYNDERDLKKLTRVLTSLL